MVDIDRLEDTVELSIRCAGRINFATAQNSVPVIRSISIENGHGEVLNNLVLTMHAQPAFIREKRWQIDRIGESDKLELSDREVSLDLAFLSGLDEAERGQLTFRLKHDGKLLKEQIVEVEVMARDEWGGVAEMDHILAAFVSPNDSAIAPILKAAAKLLSAAGHFPAMEGYQSDDPRRTYMISASIWSAITAMGLTYAEPPSSFERVGQKVRGPRRIKEEGLATCFDTSLLIAAALEAAGLNPVIIFTEGHALGGVWLVDKTLPSTVERDVTELRKAIAAREFMPFESTLLTSVPPADFAQATEAGKLRLSEQQEAEFDRAVDITRARSAGVRPLASHHVASIRAEAPSPGAAAALPAVPDFDCLPAEIADETSETPSGRIERWQRKLLDLSLRNRLLNFANSKQTIPFHCPDVPQLEDLLAADKKFRVISLTDENPIGERDPASYRKQHGKDINDEFALASMERGQVCVPLTEAEMSRRLVSLYRKAKSDMAEGGTNTLFLAAGFLRWKKSETDDRVYRAPILLLPVTLKRRSAQSAFHLAHHEDEIRINSTLFEFLKRDFGINIPALQGKLPTDNSGLDLPSIFESMRQAVRDVPGFEVVEDLALSTFSFAKYLMWKDLVDRTDQLRNNRLVRHLIDNPEEAFSGSNGSFPEPEDIDKNFLPRNLALPLPADSSQIAAVLAAAGGHDFVIIGPPGTGKSQTIANMIAHCMSLGRSVLFVAEKAAALNVVHRRLKHYGLADACLELHSNKADRRSVIRQLGAAWERSSHASEDEWIAVTEKLRIHRDKLNAYVAALHKKGRHGFSVFDAIGVVASGETAITLEFKSKDAHDPETFSNLEELAGDVARAYEVIRECSDLHPIAMGEWSYAWQSELLSLVSAFISKASALKDKARSLEESLGIPPEEEFDLARLMPLARFAKSVISKVDQDFRVVLDPEFEQLAACMVELEDAIGSVRKERSKLTASYEDSEIERIPIDDIDRDWREACSRMWPFSAFAKRKTRKLLQSYAAYGKSDPGTEIASLRTLQDKLASITESKLSSLPGFKGVDTTTESLQGFLKDASDLRQAIAELANIAQDAATLSARLTPLLDAKADRDPAFLSAREFDQASHDYEATRAAFAKHAKGALIGSTIESVCRELTAIESQKNQLANWTKWVAVRNIAVERSLTPLIESLESGQTFPAREAFRCAYFSWWLPLALDDNAELRKFAHWEHANLIAQFREFDEAAEALAAKQVCRAVVHDLPPQDGVARKSELGILRHQLSLQRPSVSIRELIGQMPATVTKLTPCVLMSPLSVAQYLPTDHALFDIVIFDEASQITTWDAIGSIARAKQSVIVGDPKQLPPSNFFGRSNDDEEDLESYERDLASILDEASASGLPTLQLNWHYRSRDEALIAFSNHHYYGNRLITFPSPATDSDALRFHKNDGVYARGSGGTNEVEARIIAAFAVKRMQEWLLVPEDERLTLGVITFNIHQQEFILDLLDAARREIPDLEWFFDEEREEPVIVKNLENIQGDERDIMLFSITFGADAAGKMTMNFGAINKDGGEKRLNVAVTRARAELHIFSSISADGIDLTRTKARGVADLKNFLDYASRGAIALPAMDSGSLGLAENVFESAIASALEARGWEVRTQIGVSGYRIDLGIVHPDRAGAFLAGVECDGATYHSSATARDRDKIREGVLRNLGWEILRVWSTDWFRNPKEAIERTDAALRELLKESNRDNGTEGEVEDHVPTDTDELGEVELEEQELASSDGSLTSHAEGDQGLTNFMISSLPKADAELFFDHSYKAVLSEIISHTVELGGPLTSEALARSVARAHGWKRAGRKIRERVVECLGLNEPHKEDGTVFIWAPGTHLPLIPFRPGTKRGPRDIPQAEILSLIADNEHLVRHEDPGLALARLMGINRLSKDARPRLENCLKIFKAKMERGEDKNSNLP